MRNGLIPIVGAKGIEITVNLTSWKEIAHSLRILANTLERYDEQQSSFSVGSVGTVKSADGEYCGGWIAIEGKVL